MRHALLAVIGLGVSLGVTSAHAGEDTDGSPLRLFVVPVGGAPVVTAPEPGAGVLAAAPSAMDPGRRFPRLPAVSITGYNLAVMGRLHEDVAAKLTVGMETYRPVRAAQTSAAVGVGLEYQF